MAPTDKAELGSALDLALSLDGPSVLRYPRDMIPQPHPELEPLELQPYKTGQAAILREGNDAAIIAYGWAANRALLAAATLAEEGIDSMVVSARFAKPLDVQLFSDLLADNKNMPIITVEDHALIGGFGAALLEFAQTHNLDARRITRLGMPDAYVAHDTRKSQLAEVGIDQSSIVNQVRRCLQQEPQTGSKPEKNTIPVRKP